MILALGVTDEVYSTYAPVQPTTSSIYTLFMAPFKILPDSFNREIDKMGIGGAPVVAAISGTMWLIGLGLIYSVFKGK